MSKFVKINKRNKVNKHFSEIRQRVAAAKKNLWIGLTDLGQEGVFRLINGTYYPTENFDQTDYLFKWGTQDVYHKEPSGNAGQEYGVEDCVHYYYKYDYLNDYTCSRETIINEDHTDFHGLCEIKKYRCLE